MKIALKSIFLIIISIFFASCSSKYKDLKTVESVDLNRYLGTWYEIARFEHYFQKDCKNVKANYSLGTNNKINVVNSCIKMTKNEFKDAKAVAYSVDETNSKLKVSFFRPFYGDYWILILDDDYKYAVVGTPSREYLWILSREKTIPEALLKSLLNDISKLDFDISKLMYTIQE